jgi:hypothetical protein
MCLGVAEGPHRQNAIFLALYKLRGSTNNLSLGYENRFEGSTLLGGDWNIYGGAKVALKLSQKGSTGCNSFI